MIQSVIQTARIPLKSATWRRSKIIVRTHLHDLFARKIFQQKKSISHVAIICICSIDGYRRADSILVSQSCRL